MPTWWDDLATALQAGAVAAAAPAACRAYDAELNNTDLAGRLLATQAAPSADACCAKCTAYLGCAGYSYNYGKCYLKGNLTGTFPAPGCRTRVFNMTGNCTGFSPPRANSDITGTLLVGGVLFADKPELCCDACRRRPTCQGFSYFASQQKCYLKTAVLEATPTYPKPGGIVRLKVPAPAAVPRGLRAAEMPANAGSVHV